MVSKRRGYINIQWWMVSELELKGNELIVYAIIYGFSQDGESRFTGSLQYLADWVGGTKQGVQKNLKSLVEKGYINKEDSYINGMKLVSYYATQLHGVCNSVVQGYATQLHGGIQLSCTNNIDNKNKEHNNKNIFIAPTVDQVADYCRERGNNVDPEKFVSYYESNGWHVGRNKMKDWKAAVRTWECNSRSYNNPVNRKAAELDEFYRMTGEFANS